MSKKYYFPTHKLEYANKCFYELAVLIYNKHPAAFWDPDSKPLITRSVNKEGMTIELLEDVVGLESLLKIAFFDSGKRKSQLHLV